MDIELIKWNFNTAWWHVHAWLSLIQESYKIGLRRKRKEEVLEISPMDGTETDTVANYIEIFFMKTGRSLPLNLKNEIY